MYSAETPSWRPCTSTVLVSGGGTRVRTLKAPQCAGDAQETSLFLVLSPMCPPRTRSFASTCAACRVSASRQQRRLRCSQTGSACRTSAGSCAPAPCPPHSRTPARAQVSHPNGESPANCRHLNIRAHCDLHSVDVRPLQRVQAWGDEEPFGVLAPMQTVSAERAHLAQLQVHVRPHREDDVLGVTRDNAA